MCESVWIGFKVDTPYCEVRNINTRNFSGRVLDCVLTDQSGQIKLTAWEREGQKDVSVMQEQLQDGSTYLVSGAQVKPVGNAKYNKGSSEGHVKTKEELKKFVLCGLSGERANSKKL